VLIPSPDIAPRHCELNVSATSVSVHPLGNAVVVDGHSRTRPGQWRGGEVLQIGNVCFQLVDHDEPLRKQLVPNLPVVGSWPGWIQLSLVLAVLAVPLIAITLASGNPRLVPAAMLMGSAVTPVSILGFVYARLGKGNTSIRSLVLTFGLGATVGLILTMIFNSVVPNLFSPMMAPLCEEPAKLVATALCWRRAGYRTPAAGCVLGFAAGSGFAVAETAGYVFEASVEGGAGAGIAVLLLRSAVGPASHGVWTALAASAWFQIGWKLQGNWGPVFGRAMITAMMLHCLWNLNLPWGTLASLMISTYLFVRILRARGAWRPIWQILP